MYTNFKLAYVHTLSVLGAFSFGHKNQEKDCQTKISLQPLLFVIVLFAPGNLKVHVPSGQFIPYKFINYKIPYNQICCSGRKLKDGKCFFLGHWGGWSECSATCGPAIQKRKRVCRSKINRQKLCYPIEPQTRKCKTTACPVPTLWQDWSQGGGQEVG